MFSDSQALSENTVKQCYTMLNQNWLKLKTTVDKIKINKTTTYLQRHLHIYFIKLMNELDSK